MTSGLRIADSRLLASSVAWLVAILGAGFPRLMVLGNMPTTDEGIYGYYAQIIQLSLAAGRGLPDTGPLMLYPALTSWVFAFSANHTILLRVIDMLVAIAAARLFYGVIERESGSRAAAFVISLVFIFTMNHTFFIQAGFKHSMFAAYVPLLLGLRLAHDATGDSWARWAPIGGLAALAVLLRESFFPFLGIGAVAVAVAHGRRAGLRFAAGALAVGLGILACVLIARGGAYGLWNGYGEMTTVFGAVAQQRGQLFVQSAGTFLSAAAVAITLASVLLVAATIMPAARHHLTQVPGRFLFWLAVALAPLLEPAMKIGFPYHFSVCLPGLAGLSALAMGSIMKREPGHPRAGVLATGACIACLWFLWPDVKAVSRHWPVTRAALAVADSNTWPQDMVPRSNYLLAAQAIREAAPPGATLSVSGFMLALFPLTGLRPPTYELAHLTSALIVHDLDESWLRNALLACPPDVLMTTTRADWPGAQILDAVVRDSGLYREATTIPVTRGISYGAFGGTIFRRISSAPAKCAKPGSPDGR